MIWKTEIEYTGGAQLAIGQGTPHVSYCKRSSTTTLVPEIAVRLCNILSCNVFSGCNQHRIPWLRIIDDSILGFGSIRDAPETQGTPVGTEHPIVVSTSNV